MSLLSCCRAQITETSHRSDETKDACDRIEKVVLLREKYLFRPKFDHPKETLSQIDNMVRHLMSVVSYKITICIYSMEFRGANARLHFWFVLFNV